MANPQIDISQIRKQCGPKYKRLKLTGIIQHWLIMHFANAANIQEAGLSARVWTDSDSTGILILPWSRWQPTTTEKRPSIIIKSNELNILRQGIDNRYLGGTNIGGPGSGTNTYATSFEGSHTIYCIAGESGEAEQLGEEVAQEMLKFAPLVRPMLNFLRMELVKIGELAKLEEASENFVVPLILTYAFMEQWQITAIDEAVLRSIQITING